ncbi:MAG: 4Fe-4S binding protein [Desulfovibrionaceae bacterium]|nr:4Fe-4S binding protein [Desulfovibrionaceae bacterium]
MSKQIRNIIKIDTDLCTGCGQCVLDCAEGAIAIVDGKARVISESYCDGLGACLQGCPVGALTIEQREAVPFDEEAAMRHVAAQKSGAALGGLKPMPQGGCPGSAMREFPMQASGSCPGSAVRTFPMQAQGGAASLHDAQPSPAAGERRLTWPVKLRLLPAHAPFLQNAHVLLAADCAAAASAGFHSLADGKVVVIACPKFEDNQDMLERLKALFLNASPASVTVIRMEVPCCRGIAALCHEAGSVTDRPVQEIIMGCDGRIRSRQ